MKHDKNGFMHVAKERQPDLTGHFALSIRAMPVYDLSHVCNDPHGLHDSLAMCAMTQVTCITHHSYV